MKRNKLGQNTFKPFKTSDFRPLYLMIGIGLIGASLWTYGEVNIIKSMEPINPFISHSYGVSKVYASEPIVVTPVLSKKTQGCMKNRPDVAKKIQARFDEYALDLICRESSFNPQAINPSSKACGLAQALPCSKMKCDLVDVDCQLDWIGDYVYQRYGSFKNAIEFHNIKNWY